MIPYGRQEITDDDVAEVVRVLRSDFVTQGPTVTRFEEAFAGRHQADHGIAFCNATAALHAACHALGVGEGDWVWTCANTFVASANCARYCGADVGFVDIDPNSLTMSPDDLQLKLEQAHAAGTLPKVIIPVHFAGQPCDMKRIRDLANQYGAKVIEDAAHAVGAEYQGAPVGNGRYADVAIFSFHPVKIMTTGEGGMALTQDAMLATGMERFRSHGITRSADLMEGDSHGPWYYQQLELGCNYRMTDIQAALGVSQLERLDAFLEARRVIAKKYTEAFSGISTITPPQLADDRQSAWHLYMIRQNGATLEENRAAFEALRNLGVGVNKLYIPVDSQPYYRRLYPEAQLCERAEVYYRQCLALRMYSSLTSSETDQVIEAVGQVFG